MRQAGFTLLEVMVALIVLGAATAVLLPELGAGTRAVERGAERLVLSQVAATLLDRVGTSIPLTDGTTEGVESIAGLALDWRVSIVRELRARAPDDPPEALRLHRVTVALARRGSAVPLLSVTTLRAIQ